MKTLRLFRFHLITTSVVHSNKSNNSYKDHSKDSTIAIATLLKSPANMLVIDGRRIISTATTTPIISKANKQLPIPRHLPSLNHTAKLQLLRIVEAVFAFVCDINGDKIFKKRK